MYTVYLMTHTPTQLQYIGMTKRSIDERFIDHMARVKTYGRNSTKLDSVINTSSVNDFTITPLDENIKTEEEAIRIESERIAEYNTFHAGLNSSAYNTRLTLSPEEQRRVSNAYRGGLSFNQIRKIFNINNKSIDSILRKDGFEVLNPKGLHPPPFGIVM